MPEEVKPIEEAAATTSAETTEVVEEAKEEKKETEAAQTLGADDLEERIANRVYDRMKGFVGELMKSSEDISQMISESVSAKAEEMAPPETTEEEVVEDVKPTRSHRLFSRPMRKRE